MGKALLRINRKREKGKLYYLATDKEGYLVLCEALMRRAGRKRKEVKNE